MSSPYADSVLGWYAAHARDLPWRAPGVSPWAVLVSEIMLQQTPVSRVLPAYQAWLTRWPTPAALAADASGEAVRQWGRLGYPRRALRLHETAVIVTQRYAGELPSTRDELLALPGIGAYTAAAVAVFAFGRKHAVLDTNVRRVFARRGIRARVPWHAALGSGIPPGRVAIAGRRRHGGALVGRRHGAGRPDVHGGSARVATTARSRSSAHGWPRAAQRPKSAP